VLVAHDTTERQLMLDAALQYRADGYKLVFCEHGTKRALDKGWERKEFTETEIRYRLSRHTFNIAARLDCLFVFDKDAASREAYNFLRKHRIKSRMEVTTSKGIHVWMRLDREIEDLRSRIRFNGMPLDVLTGERYVMLPPSWNEEAQWRYAYRPGKQFLPMCDLPVVPESVIELLTKREEPECEPKLSPGPVRSLVLGTHEEASALLRHERYVERIEKSEQGNNGSRACIRACLKILSLVEGDAARAWPLIVHFNRTRCQPAWDEEAEEGPDSLRRKLNEALKFWRPQC